jgi:DNA repair protein RadD
MQFIELISRADDEVLQSLLGVSTLRLLKLLDPNSLSPSRLRQVLLRLRSSHELLLGRDSRALLLDLLRPNEAEQLAVLLGIQHSKDLFSALSKLSIARNSIREKALLAFFELPELPADERETKLSIQSCKSSFALFAHQRQAARRARRALSQEPHRVLLHMPTGAGKTRTAMHIVADHLRSQEPTLVIWLAYSEELCEQAATEFENAWTNLGDRDIDVHRFWGEHNLELDTAYDGIVVASLTKLYRAALSSLHVISTLAGRCSLVIIDEAHQAIAETYQLVLNTLVTQGRNGSLLGLTATPGRTWNDVGADAKLASFFGRQKVTLQVQGYSNPVEYLVDQGYLARAIYRPLLHTTGVNLSEADIRRIEQELDIPSDILQRISVDEQRNLSIVVEVEQLIKRHHKLIVFAASVNHAQLLAAVLAARGHHAAAITGNTPASERSRLIDDYKSTTLDPRILCNYGVLTTGFDAPQTSAALIARPTRSLVLYSQMVGRAIRGPRVGGNATAEIVTVVDTELTGFGSIVDAFSNWEDVWSEL